MMIVVTGDAYAYIKCEKYKLRTPWIKSDASPVWNADFVLYRSNGGQDIRIEVHSSVDCHACIRDVGVGRQLPKGQADRVGVCVGRC